MALSSASARVRQGRETDEGFQGLGEAGLTGWELAVAGAREHFRPLLRGVVPFRTEHLGPTLWRGGFYPAGQVLTAAIAAVDLASSTSLGRRRRSASTCRTRPRIFSTAVLRRYPCSRTSWSWCPPARPICCTKPGSGSGRRAVSLFACWTSATA